MVAARERNLPAPVANMQQVAWDDIRLFLAVAGQGSVRAAGLEMGVNASTVSRRLKSLEQSLGTKLFERHASGLRLTEAGREASAFGQHLQTELRELQIRLASRQQALKGNLRITCAEVVADLVARHVGEFLEQHPRIQVELKISDAMVSVEKHEVDIAVRVADTPAGELVGKRVGRSAVGLFASRAYLARRPWRPEELEQNVFIEWPAGLEHKPAFQWLNQHYSGRRVSTRANSAGAVLSCVRAGMGVAPLALSQALRDPDLIHLESFPESCSTNVWLLTHRDIREAARVRAALDYLGEALVRDAEELG